MRTLLCASVLVVSAASHAVVIYDTLNPAGSGYSRTGGLPRNHIGTTFNTLTPPSGNNWDVTSLVVPIVFGVPGLYNVSAQIRVYNDSTNAVSGTDPVFSDLISDVTWTFTLNHTGTGVVFSNVNFDYAAANLNFLLQDGQAAGFEVILLNNGQATNDLTVGLRDAAPTVGGAPSGHFYRDADGNGFINGSDARSITGWTNTSMGLQVNADAVPEPATMTILGLGLAAAALKRRKKA